MATIKKPNYASLYTLRKDGRYVGTYTDDSGERHHVYDRDPERLWHKLNDPKEVLPLTFRDIAKAWYAARWDSIRAGTQASYTAPYRRAVDLYGDKPAADLQVSDIKAHLERLKARGLGAKSIKTQRTIYSVIYKYAINDEELGKTVRFNPAADVKLPSGMKKPVERQAPEDQMVAAIRSRAGEAYWGLFCLFLISTGFRRGEALGLRWRDVDFKKKEIHCHDNATFRNGRTNIGPVKTDNGERTVPLLPDLLPALRAYKNKDADPEDFVFPGDDPKKPMVESTYRRRWMHYCRDMGFVTDVPEERVSKQGKKYIKHNYKPTLTAHVLRHGYATMLYDAEVDVYVARKLLGHSDIKTTLAIYTHLKQQRENSSLKNLEKYVAAAISQTPPKTAENG